MKELRVSCEELLLLMDALNLMEAAFVYTHYSCEDYCKLKNLRNRVREAWDDK